MIKKIGLSLIMILSLSSVSLSQILTEEAVDLYNTTKNYKDIVKVVDNFKFMEIYPDHTFRGEKKVDRKELTLISLKIIQYIENLKKISLKKENSIILESYQDTDDQLMKTITNLSENYSISVFKNIENKYDPKKNITISDFNYLINQVFNLYNQINKNPYSNSNQDINLDSIDYLVKLGIIKDKSVLKNEVSRNEMVSYLLKLVNYLQ